MITLGVTARDVVSGYQGIVVSRAEWLTGQPRLGIQATPDTQGKAVPIEWFDEASCIVVNGMPIELPKKE